MFYNTKFEHSLEENEDGEVQRKNEESFLSLSLLCDKMKNVHGKVKSHNIYIVSCYYSINSIQTLLDSLEGRKVHIIISALGHSQEKIEEIIKDLKKIEKNRNKKIYVCSKFPLLHSKIYYAENERADGANCLVGSANLSENGFSNNEEVLVDVEDVGAKQQIKSYIKKLIEQSIDIDRYTDFCVNDNSFSDFMSFISAGYIVFRPNNQIQLNYFGEKLREIAKELKSDVENGTRNSELSIDLEKYISSKEYLNFKINTKIKSGARIKDHCIETCFGYWLPYGKHHDILNVCDDGEIKKKTDQVENVKAGLMKIDVDSKPFQEFLEKIYASIKNGEQPVYISDSQKTEIAKDIKAFITRQIKYIDNRKNSIARGFLITPIPYFWDDRCAAEEFYNSFGENVESRKYKGIAKKIWEYFEKDYQKKNWTTLKTKANKEWE